MFRQASRLLDRASWLRPRPFCTEVPAATPSADPAFVEAWKKVMPNMDPPRTPSTYMEPRPPVPSSLPSKMTVNFVLPYSSELSAKEVSTQDLMSVRLLFHFFSLTYINLVSAI